MEPSAREYEWGYRYEDLAFQVWGSPESERVEFGHEAQRIQSR
jgi:hypothetical protein